MKHQYTAIILATTLVHALCGCGGNNETHIDQYGSLVDSLTGEPILGCGTPDDGIIGDVEDVADSGLGLTGQITKFMGYRADGSQSNECWNSSTQVHDCNVLGDMLIKYEWTPGPGFVDNNAFYQIRVGLLNALGDLNTYAGANGPKFTHLSGDKTMPIKYGFNTAACTPGGDCSFASAGFTSTRIDGASPQIPPSSFAPVRAIYKAAGYTSDFNLTRMVNGTKSCYNTQTPTDAMYNSMGRAYGRHEFMHVRGFTHVSEVVPNAMNSTLSCAIVRGEAGAVSIAQRNAQSSFRAGTWTNGVLLSGNPTLER